MPTSTDKLMRRIMGLERRVRDNALTPRLGNSSIDNGGAITINDPSTGLPSVIIGEQPDGTQMVNHTNGPPPPQPSLPVLEGLVGFILVTWDGRFADDQPESLIPTPLDFSRCEIHASTDPDFEPSPASLMGTIESARGGQKGIGVPYGEEFYVRLVVRSLSGKGSPASDAAIGTAHRVEAFDVEDLALTVTKFKTLSHQIY